MLSWAFHVRATMSTQHKRPLCYTRRRSRENHTEITPVPDTVKGGVLTGLLNSIKNPLKKSVRDEWVPILNYEYHLQLLKKDGCTDEHLDKIRARHVKYYNEHPPMKAKPRADYSIPFKPTIENDVAMSLRVGGNDTVSIKILENPFKNFYNESNTVDDYLEMYTKAGCSDDFISLLKHKFNDRADRHARSSAHMDRVMSRYSGKSSTKVKKITLRSRFAKQMKTTAIKAEEVKIVVENVDEE